MEKSQSSKYTVKVDLTRCGGDTPLSLQIVTHSFGYREDLEPWKKSWVGLRDGIGNELKDDKWEETYDLFEKNNIHPIRSGERLRFLFKDANRRNLDKTVYFYVGVKFNTCYYNSLQFFFFFSHLLFFFLLMFLFFFSFFCFVFVFLELSVRRHVICVCVY